MAEPVVKEKLWSQICDEADPEAEDKTQYVFSNGRKFVVSK